MLAMVALKSLDKIIVDSGVVPTIEEILAKKLEENIAEQLKDMNIIVEVGKFYCAKVCNASVKVI